MNENIDLTEILKNCPRGTKLYSIVYGEVEFVGIKNNCITNYPIICGYESHDGNYYMNNMTIDGKYDISSNGECTLFPSKDQRDWSKFSIEPKFDINTLQPFDKVLVRNGNDNWTCTLFSNIITTDNKNHFFKCINNMWTQCIPYNEETKHLVGTTKKPPKEYITWKE